MTVFALSLLTVCYGHTLELFKHHELLFLVPIKKKKLNHYKNLFLLFILRKGQGDGHVRTNILGKKKKEAKQHLQLHLLYLFIKRLKSKDIHVRGVT